MWQRHKYKEWAAADHDGDDADDVDDWGSWKALKQSDDKQQGWHRADNDADDDKQQWVQHADTWADDDKQQWWHHADTWADDKQQWWHHAGKDADDKQQWGHRADTGAGSSSHDDDTAAEPKWGTWANPNKYPGALLMGNPDKPVLKPQAKSQPTDKPVLKPQAKSQPAWRPTPPSKPPPALRPTPPSKPPPAALTKAPPSKPRPAALKPTPPSKPPAAALIHSAAAEQHDGYEGGAAGGITEFDEPVIDAIIDELRAREIDATGYSETARNEANRAYNEMVGIKRSRGTTKRAGKKAQRQRTAAALTGDGESDDEHEHRLVSRTSVQSIIDQL